MNKEEMKEKFMMLYNYMAVSNEPKYMMLFGNVMKDMMMWLIENRPEAAEAYIEILCSIKWRQYLTRGEAMEVVKGMRPSAAWDYDTWHNAMKSLGLECEREFEYNSYALWVVMNAMYSDNGKVIADLMGISPTDTGNVDMIKVIYTMSLNLLLDEDEKYCVRSYFLNGR